MNDTDTVSISDSLIITRLRRFLLGVAAFICLGTVAELVLHQHWQETTQLIPFTLCVFGLIALAAVMMSPQPNTILVLRVVMVALIGGSLLGIGLHLYNNFAFELDIRPNAAVGDVVVDALMGANPLLAPGILALAGVLAIAATYHHPALRKTDQN